MRYVLIFFIHVYQKTISPLLGDVCRFEPSCSHYGEEAIRRFGSIKGGYLTIRRILRCNPHGGHGYDPVPETWEDRPRRNSKKKG